MIVLLTCTVLEEEEEEVSWGEKASQPWIPSMENGKREANFGPVGKVKGEVEKGKGGYSNLPQFATGLVQKVVGRRKEAKQSHVLSFSCFNSLSFSSYRNPNESKVLFFLFSLSLPFSLPRESKK